MVFWLAEWIDHLCSLHCMAPSGAWDGATAHRGAWVWACKATTVESPAGMTCSHSRLCMGISISFFLGCFPAAVPTRGGAESLA